MLPGLTTAIRNSAESSPWRLQALASSRATASGAARQRAFRRRVATDAGRGLPVPLQLTGNRRKIGVDDPRLEDRVADNLAEFDPTESETIRFGTGFGVGTDIQTSPAGTLHVVSLSNNAVYEIFPNR